ncbi:MAG: type I methionyl aminopeptidase [Candidatus Pacebacteria bacterium]|nr:type I methionyl aminopeptidase [Candidatus Paceibacterota bacterium]
MTAARSKRRVPIHTEEEIAGIRTAAQAAAWVRDRLRQIVKPGMTTLAVDHLASELIRETGGESAFYKYRGFPGRICVSLDDEVVHGIGRADRCIQAGTVVSLDVGVKLNGFIGDTAVTFCPGTAADPQTVTRLIEGTRESLDAGILAARANNHVNAIGHAVEKVVRSYGLSVVRDFVGHGCGCELHEPPEVPNFATPHPGPKLQPGMILAIEPMVNTGSHDVTVDADGWTVRTKDGGLSAHFEHMVLITKRKAEILTWPKKP